MTNAELERPIPMGHNVCAENSGADRLKSLKRPFADTQEMLKRARGQGLIDLMLEGLGEKDKKHLMECLIIAYKYAFSDFSLEDIGNSFNISDITAGKRRTEAISRILACSPVEFKEMYPFDDLTLKKPESDAAKRRRGATVNSYTHKLEQSAKLGTTARELMREGDIDKDNLSALRRRLKAKGIEVGHVYKAYDIKAEITNRIKQGPLPDEEAQELLWKVTRGLYDSWHGHDDALVMLKEMVTHAGFRYVNQYGPMYAEALKGKMPLGVVRNKKNNSQGEIKTSHFAFRHDLRRSDNILRKDHALAPYKLPPKDKT